MWIANLDFPSCGCRSSAGPSNWVERFAFVPFLDESDDEGVLPMDMDVIPKDHYRWVAVEFSISALSKHFGQARDS